MSKSKNIGIAFLTLLAVGFAVSVGSKAQNITANFKASPLLPNDFNLQGGINFNLPIQIINQSSFDVTVNNIYISVQTSTGNTWQDLFYMTSPVKTVLIRKQAATNINQVPLKADYTSAYTILQIINGSVSSNLKVVVRFEAVGIQLTPIEFFIDAKQLLAPFKSVLGSFLNGLPSGNTLGYQSKSAHYRKINPDGSKYDSYFPKPKSLTGFASQGTDPNNTVKLMAEQVERELPETARITPILKGKNIAESCFNVYTFLHDNIQYQHDDHMMPLSKRDEVLRSPARSWAERKEGIDCDCFTKFAISIFKNMGIPCTIKAVSIRPDHALQHVYAIVPLPSNPKGYIVIDPCVHVFDQEPQNITNQILKQIA